MKSRCLLSMAFLGLVAATPAWADRLVLFAGGGTEESGVPATKARLVDPFGVDSDKAGNFYMVELQGGRVLKIDAKGTLTVLAGTKGKKGSEGDGVPAAQATFNGMHSLAVTPDGAIYLADTWNNRVRKIGPASGKITTVAGTGKGAYSGDGGPAIAAEVSGIHCVAFDFDFRKLYLTDLDNRRIRVLDLKTGAINLVAGNGKKGVPENGADARSAPLIDPRAACIDRKGNVYILERSGHALRVVDTHGKIRTVAGTGKKGYSGDGGDALQATLNGPKHLCIDLDDNVIIADSGNHVIRKFIPKTGKIVRLAGTGKKGQSQDGGEALEVPMNEPHGVYVHPSGTLYISDSNNGRVFRLEK